MRDHYDFSAGKRGYYVRRFRRKRYCTACLRRVRGQRKRCRKCGCRRLDTDGRFWILTRDKQPQFEWRLLLWGRMFESRKRVVAQTKVGDTWVSTVFIGIPALTFDMDANPQVFETLTFTGEDGAGDSMERYATYRDAWFGHYDTVNKVRDANDPTVS